MKPLIFKQLKKCKNVSFDNLTGEELTIVIPKCTHISADNLQLYHTYLIQVDRYILGLTKDNSTLVSNWNAGQEITSEYLLVSLSKMVNNMYQFDGVGFDMNSGESCNDTYSGIWIPKEHFVVIKEITQ